MKLDTPDFNEGDLYIRLHLAAMSQLHLAEEFQCRKRYQKDGVAFTLDTDGLTMENLREAAELVARKQLDAGTEQAERNKSNPWDSSSWDKIFLHGTSVLRHALNYTELRHAVKHGDPGRMKALFPYLIPIFKATGKHRYANEMLETLQRWEYEWSDDVKATMLGHSLVNESGEPDGFIGIDLWQEPDVRLHKVDFPINNSRSLDGQGIHQHLGGCLHTLRSIRKSFWGGLDITTRNAKAAVLRNNHDIMTLVRMWNDHNIVKWIPQRSSRVFATCPQYLGRGKTKAKEDSEEQKTVRTDSLQQGMHILTSGKKSKRAFARRRDLYMGFDCEDEDEGSEQGPPVVRAADEDEDEQEEEEEDVPLYVVETEVSL